MRKFADGAARSFQWISNQFSTEVFTWSCISALHCMLSSLVFQLIDSPGQMLVLRRFHSEMSVEFIPFSSNLPFQQSTAISRGMSIQVHFNDTDAFHWNRHMSFISLYVFIDCWKRWLHVCLRHFDFHESLRHG